MAQFVVWLCIVLVAPAKSATYRYLGCWRGRAGQIPAWAGARAATTQFPLPRSSIVALSTDPVIDVKYDTP